jgi:hypothetical protein
MVQDALLFSAEDFGQAMQMIGGGVFMLFVGTFARWIAADYIIPGKLYRLIPKIFWSFYDFGGRLAQWIGSALVGIVLLSLVAVIIIKFL